MEWKNIKEFLTWALSDGEKFATDLGYAPLPPTVITKAMEKVNRITF